MDWAFMGKYAPMYVEAAGLTLRIGCAGVLLSIVLGALCCLARSFRVPGLRQLAGAYGDAVNPDSLVVEGGVVE